MKFSTFTLAAVSAVALVACGGGDTSAPSTQSSTTEASAPVQQSGNEIRIVGSSTVYPFSIKVAQEFKNKTGYNVIVESTGSGGGHKLFCDGAKLGTPNVTNSSRRQKSSEFNKCMDAGVDGIVEVKIGYDGIVVANAIDSPVIDMSMKDIYLAFAKNVPIDDNCTMAPNPYTRWSEIEDFLPDFRIEAYGPPPTSGTRDAFVEIAMEKGAKEIPCLAALSKTDKAAFKQAAHIVREDGYWIDSGENDNALVQTLVNTPTAVGVFGYSFLEQNSDKVKGAKVGAASPTFENIASGDYPVSRSLYFYIKKDHVGQVPGLQEYALEFTSEAASGPGGYLEEIGLVPLPDAERTQYRKAVVDLIPYSQ